MIQPQYQLTYIATNTTTTIEAAAKNITIHTVVCPIATTGTVTFTDIAGSPATYFVLPIGSIGTLRFDTIFGNGLKVVTSAADKVMVTTQTP